MAQRWKAVWKYQTLYYMLLPGLIYYAVYRYGPMWGSIIAFKDFNIVDGIWGSSWADPWYKHFAYFYNSPYFGQIMANTFLISVYKIVWGMPPGIILALMIYEVRSARFKKLIQTISYLPHFLSWVIIYGMIFAFLSETSGLVSRWIKEYIGHTIPFLTSTEWFRTILVSSEVWQSAGWGAIIYLAALAGIDPTLYEAARCDGAGRLRMLWHISLPGIRSVIVLMLILKLGHILDAGFDQIYIMYNVHVYPVADIIDTWVFRVGLEQLNFSLGAAVGLFKSLIGLALVVGANRIARRWGENVW